MVVRTDDHGLNYLVKDNLDSLEAVELLASLPAYHKQSYFVLEYILKDREATLLKHGVIV